MEKIILTDKTGFQILPGASLGSITVITDDFAGLQTVADALLKEENLSEVKFQTGEEITGEYADMKLETPLFRSVDLCTDKGKVAATFAIRKKTEMELAIEELQNGQKELREGQIIQDGAIGDLGNTVSEIVEGGAV